MSRIWKVRWWVSLVAVLALIAAACGGESADGGGDVTGDDESAKVALLLPGVITDRGFNQSVYEAAVEEAEEQGFELSHTESVGIPQAVEAFRGYARQGNRLVLGVGEEFVQPAIEVGQEFPDVHFVVINGNDSSDTVASVRLDQWPLGYLSGVLAARTSESGTVGVINGIEFSSTQRIADGFEKGAQATDPTIEVLSVFTGDFADPALGKEAASAMISEGADVIVNALNEGAQGVIEAAQAADGVHLIGFFTDQGELFDQQDLYLTSGIASWPEATKEIISIEARGEFEGQVYTFSVENERFAFLAPLGPAVSSEAADEVQAVTEQFRSGELTAPDTP